MNPVIKQWLNSVCVWIDATPMSQAMQNAPWAIPAVQTVHILAIAALMASMVMINLRLVGVVGRDQTLARVAARFIPVMGWALPVLLASGIVLIIGEPARALKNNIFQIKMLLVISAIIVTVFFTHPLKKNPAYWDGRAGLGMLVALVSTALWIGIIFAGRWIAYY